MHSTAHLANSDVTASHIQSCVDTHLDSGELQSGHVPIVEREEDDFECPCFGELGSGTSPIGVATVPGSTLASSSAGSSAGREPTRVESPGVEAQHAETRSDEPTQAILPVEFAQHILECTAGQATDPGLSQASVERHPVGAVSGPGIARAEGPAGAVSGPGIEVHASIFSDIVDTLNG